MTTGGWSCSASVHRLVGPQARVLDIPRKNVLPSSGEPCDGACTGFLRGEVVRDVRACCCAARKPPRFSLTGLRPPSRRSPRRNPPVPDPGQLVHSGWFDLCTGDWVTVADGTVVDLVPRRTAIMRAAVTGRAESQLLAANVDAVGIVTALDGEVDLGRIERMLALAWESGAQPIVILTKSDAAEHVVDTVAAVQAIAPGCSVLAISAVTGDALDILTAMLDGTIVLIGPSGACKSTLANALIGAEVLATNAVRTVDGKGRHTTS